MGDFKETAKQHVQGRKTKSDWIKAFGKEYRSWAERWGTGKNQKIMQDQGR